MFSSKNRFRIYLSLIHGGKICPGQSKSLVGKKKKQKEKEKEKKKEKKEGRKRRKKKKEKERKERRKIKGN